MKKRILIISQSWLHKDPRVLSQYRSLCDDYIIETLGYSPINETVKHYKLSTKSLNYFHRTIYFFLRHLRLYNYIDQFEFWMLSFEKLESHNYDVIICNDLSALPIGTRISNNTTPIWTDLHEYSPRQFENFDKWNKRVKPYVYWQARKYLVQSTINTTVCEGLANEYEREFKVKIDYLIFNAPSYQELSSQQVSAPIKLVHHGGATRHRKLESMIELIKNLGDGYTLDFYLMAHSKETKSYIEELQEIVKKENLNVFFNDPVETNKISKEINKYDIGVFILEPVNFNYLNALPNKFFEFLQARLAIAISPNPEMKKLVQKWDNGVYAIDYTPQSLANEIRKLSIEKIFTMKKNSSNFAKLYNSQDTKNKIDKIMSELLQNE